MGGGNTMNTSTKEGNSRAEYVRWPGQHSWKVVCTSGGLGMRLVKLALVRG